MHNISKILKFLIFIILYLSTLVSIGYIFSIFFHDLGVFISFILVFLAIFWSSRYLRKRNPDKFIQKSSKFSIAYFFLTVSLSFFLLSLVFDSVKIDWTRFVNENTAYKGILDATVLPIFILFPAFATIYPVWRLYSRKKGLLVNTVIAFLYVSFWILMLYLFARNIFGLESLLHTVGDTINYYYEIIAAILIVPLLKFTVGFLPLGWFYELFVGTVAPQSLSKG